MADLKSRREKLQKAIEQKKEQLKRVEAKEKQIERKKDTRRKVIAGALALEHALEFADKDPDFQATMIRLLNRHVRRPHDRALFAEIIPGFSENPSQEPASEQDQGTPIRDTFKSNSA